MGLAKSSILFQRLLIAQKMGGWLLMKMYDYVMEEVKDITVSLMMFIALWMGRWM